jgi:hypothetical protein
VLPSDDEEKRMAAEQRDRQFAELVAQAVMARFLHAVQSDEVASKVMETWGGNLDRVIGRALRRLGFYLLIGLVALGSAKLGLLDKIAGFLKP